LRVYALHLVPWGLLAIVFHQNQALSILHGWIPTVLNMSNSPFFPEKEICGKIPCPDCAEPIFAVRGSFSARCKNCGFKDACCF
jgi:hypothetical protein